MLRREEYRIGADLFVKEYLPPPSPPGAGGSAPTGEYVRFWKNGRLLDLEAWNRELNRFQSMAIKERHPNPLVRWKERHRRRGFLRMVETRPGEVVADVGCESGYLAAELVRRGNHVICVDIDPALLELARQRIATASTTASTRGGARGGGLKRAEYVVSNIEAIQLADASVDVVIASEVLEHLPAPEVGLRELIRITRPGGDIFLSVPNELLVLAIKKGLRALRLTCLLGQLSEGLAIGHVQVFRKIELVRLCQMEGVTIQRIAYHKPFCMNIFAHLRRE